MSTVLITGANRGIGLELVRAHTVRGDRVIAVCREASNALLRSRAEIIAGVDMANPEAFAMLQERLQTRSLDRVIANAGLRGLEGYDDLDFDAVRHQFEVNTLGPLRLVRSLDGMLASGAKVILVSTLMGSLGDNQSGGEFGYRLSKAALNMAGINLAHAFKTRKIGVFLLHPGFVRTDLTGGKGLLDADQSARSLVAIADRLGIADTGTFWHAVDGTRLPW